MEILERLFKNERTLRAIFGLGAEKFDSLDHFNKNCSHFLRNLLYWNR